MEVMQNLVKGCLHCEAFVIWGWLHNLRMDCHVDESTSDRWPRSHAMCFLMQRWPRLHAMCSLSPPQENSRCFAVCYGKLAPLSEPLHDGAVRHGHIRGLSFFLSLFSSVSLSSHDSFSVITLSLSRSLVFFMFIYFFFSFDATVLLGPGGPSPTSRPVRTSTCPGRTQPSL
jgi:hypothetical protein